MHQSYATPAFEGRGRTGGAITLVGGLVWVAWPPGDQYATPPPTLALCSPVACGGLGEQEQSHPPALLTCLPVFLWCSQHAVALGRRGAGCLPLLGTLALQNRSQLLGLPANWVMLPIAQLAGQQCTSRSQSRTGRQVSGGCSALLPSC